METAQSAFLVKPCPRCERELFTAVLFCPFCAAEQGLMAQPPSPPAAAPAPAVVPERSPPPPRQTPAQTPVSPSARAKPPAAAPAAATVEQSQAVSKPSRTSAKTSTKADPPVTPEPHAKPPKPAADPTPSKDAPVTETRPSGWPVWAKLVLLIGLVGGGYGYLTRSSSNPCDELQTGIRSKLSQGDSQGARADLSSLSGLCTSAEAKARATALRQEVEKAVAAEALCDRGYRKVSGLISDLRLHSARNALDALSSTCQAGPSAKDARTQLEAKLQQALTTEAELRARLRQGDAQGARASLDELAGIDREHPGLADLRAEVLAAQRAAAVAGTANSSAAPAPQAPVPASNPAPAPASAVAPMPAVAPTAVPAPAVVTPRTSAATTPVVVAPRPAPATPPAALPVANPQSDMAQSFLRDAEQALGQLKFDAAKTYVESARRLDPANPQIGALARRIRERELEYTRKEMTIN